LRKKVMRAVTDEGPQAPNSPKSEPLEHLFTLLKIVSTPDVVSYFDEQYNNCSIRYGDLKKQLAEDIIAAVAPIRERIEDIRNNDKYLHEVTMLGAEKARKSARETIDEVRRIMGIYSF
jgi:tryptophanyl-tRNA synthetase